MSASTDFNNLRATLSALTGHGVVPGVSAALQNGRDGFVRELISAVSTEVPAYIESGNPELIPELEAHIGEIVDAACQLLSGERVGPLAFVAEHAQRRAAQNFPLDAHLHADRCAHRNLTRWVRDAALEAPAESAQVRRVVAAVTDFTVEFTGALGTVLTSEYVAHTRALAEAEGDRRTRLLLSLIHI